ncbi:MAG TPA: molybdopterin cofactor-binding domain-containing protein [Bryobacteraceae bacterium]|nr:molybdopterin cofactor-binding domain-containing protein [Bryobacteraceae bacterium]
MNPITNVSRRNFLEGVFSAGAFVLAARYLPENAQAAETVDESAWHPSVYLGFEPDGRVIIVAHRSEMGTGIRTALPMVVAEELDADWSRVKIQQAIGDKKYGDQNTDGSNSIKGFYQPMRVAGATARTMLESAAAAKWGVPASECAAKNHEIVHTPSGKKLGFGELATSAATQTVPKPETLKFKPASEYRYIGKNIPITDQNDIVSGKGTFGQDAKVPGMVYASIERSPVLGGTLKSVDDSEAKKVGGVIQTTTIDPFKPPYMFQALGGVAVIADNTWSALQGRKKLKLDWDLGQNATYDTVEYKKTLQETVRKPGTAERNVGDVDKAFAGATKTHEAEYWVPHLSHAPMEPPAAIAEFKNGKVTAWAPTQNPQAVQQTVAAAVGIKPEDVTCYVTLLGGGFGRKSKPDYVAEAAILSKQLNKPVKVVWSREDDIHFDYFHFCAAMYMKAALDEKGRPTAWLGRASYPPMLSQNQLRNGGLGSMGWTDLPFDIPNFRAENGPAEAHIRIGWLRSVANIPHAFAVHSFVDELGALAGRDRVEYLLEILGKDRIIETRPAAQQNRPNPYPIDTARTRRVLEAVAEQSGWAKKKSGAGHGYGVAVHRSFFSYIATVVEVEVENGKLRIPRVDTVVDAGLVVHPDRVKAQFEGAAVFGAGLTMSGEITAANGRIVQSNFNNYTVARMDDSPIETHVSIMQSDQPPAGVGEPGVPPIAPAICNAIFAATGKRIRELPIRKQLA